MERAGNRRKQRPPPLTLAMRAHAQRAQVRVSPAAPVARTAQPSVACSRAHLEMAARALLRVLPRRQRPRQPALPRLRPTVRRACRQPRLRRRVADRKWSRRRRVRRRRAAWTLPLRPRVRRCQAPPAPRHSTSCGMGFRPRIMPSYAQGRRLSRAPKENLRIRSADSGSEGEGVNDGSGFR